MILSLFKHAFKWISNLKSIFSHFFSLPSTTYHLLPTISHFPFAVRRTNPATPSSTAYNLPLRQSSGSSTSTNYSKAFILLRHRLSTSLFVLRSKTAKDEKFRRTNRRIKVVSPARKTMSLSNGFTLVEMMIVAPIVILVIGVFVSAIVNMTGEVLAVRGANALTYNVQNALNTIDADVKASGGYLATNSITLTAGQGYDNGSTSVTAFNNANTEISGKGTMLILNSYATTANPLASTRNYIYSTGQPNACNSTSVSQNSKLMTNIVYFVKDNALWRRVIMPSTYESSGCSVPWQRPTCAVGYTAVFCKANDTKLVDGISTTGFDVDYYVAGSTTANTVANDSAQTDAARLSAMLTTNTVSVTINAAKTYAGRDVTQAGTIKSVSANDNSKIPVTSIAVISGTASVGQTLTAGSLVPSNATVSYQWQSATTSGGTYANISGANSATYLLVAGDALKYIKVVATGTGVYSGSQISAASNIVIDTGWIAGVAATAMAGKAVRSADYGSPTTIAYKTTTTADASPQSTTGLDISPYNTNMVLVADNTVDFVTISYPARQSCKAVGGRLPNMTELLSISANKASYGTFTTSHYWSAVEHATTTNAYYSNFNYDANISNDVKSNPKYVRCVAG